MDQRQRAKDLIELAVGVDTPEKERVAAAVKAVGLIHKHDLLSSPLDGLLGSSSGTVRAAVDIFGRISDPDFVSNLKTIGREIASARKRGGGRTYSRRRG